jgi:adenosylmethionine-8-amino-7-oxononanoate aminotransferase
VTSPVWHPFTQHGLNEPVPLVTHAEGAALYTADGRRVIDAISSWWVTTHGHCHPKIMAAIREQAEKLDQLIFAGWTHEPAETVARELVALMPRPLDHVFFSDSGSTSVEVALKMALGHFANRGEAKNGWRHRIVVMADSYHGDTVGGMSVGARGVFNKSYAPLLFDVDVIPFPEAGAEQASIDSFERLCADRPAALIVEPLLLGAGGMRMYPAWVLKALRELCAAHGVLFISDEVMTGWGRTGTLLACEQAGVVPDLLCLSKGLTGGSLPLAVTMATPAIFESHRSTDRAKMFFHSSSYTANPIACAAAAANLSIWRDEPVLERVADLGGRQAAHARALEGKVNNLRQLGTIVAMELEDRASAYLSSLGPKLMTFFRERDVLLRPLGNTVYVMPPYCISHDDLARIYAVIGEALDL